MAERKKLPIIAWVGIVLGLGGVCVVAVMVLSVFAFAGWSTYRSRAEGSRPVASSAPLDHFGLRYAIERWQLDHAGTCPSLEDLRAAGLLMPEDAVDDAGRPWSLTCNGATIVASTPGPDAVAGSPDDVVIRVGG